MLVKMHTMLVKMHTMLVKMHTMLVKMHTMLAKMLISRPALPPDFWPRSWQRRGRMTDAEQREQMELSKR